MTIVDPDTDVVHVGVENPDGVVTFDLATGTAGQSWDLTPWMSGPANQGLEGLAHVDGVFWAGLQDTGELFRFRLLPNGSVQLLGSQPSRAGRRDISGLHYDASTGVLYAIHDTFDVIVEYEPPGTFAREYSLPADNQEGIALVGAIATQSGVFVAQDNGPVLEYSSYPIEPRGVFEIVNGSGINPVCFTSSAPIAIGSVWASQISAAGHPGATTGASSPVFPLTASSSRSVSSCSTPTSPFCSWMPLRSRAARPSTESPFPRSRASSGPRCTYKG